jgi:hypothetical protein
LTTRSFANPPGSTTSKFLGWQFMLACPCSLEASMMEHDQPEFQGHSRARVMRPQRPLRR